MQITNVIESWQHRCWLCFRWRARTSVTYKVLFAVGMACVTGALAQLRVYLPFTPVPVTGQVLGVLLSSVLLGGGFGALSQVFYAGFGFAGIPWFAGSTMGAAVLLGPSGGYILGFIPAAYFLGRITDRYVSSRRLVPQIALMLTAVGVIYLCGAIQFVMIMHTGLADTMRMAVLPFIPVDIFKAFLAAGISSALLPHLPYNGEADSPKHRTS
jgi:biotin transport system substrate-specific component